MRNTIPSASGRMASGSGLAQAPGVAGKPKLLDQLRAAPRSYHCSRRTEQADCRWAKRFIFYHGVRHPQEMGELEINAFLSHLAVKDKVSASTGRQGSSHRGRHRAARQLSHFPSFLRNPPVRGRLRYPDHSGVAGSQRCQHDHDFAPIYQQSKSRPNAKNRQWVNPNILPKTFRC